MIARSYILEKQILKRCYKGFYEGVSTMGCVMCYAELKPCYCFKS